MMRAPDHIDDIALQDARNAFSAAVDKNSDELLAKWARLWGAALLDRAGEAVEADDDWEAEDD
jgi:hypothetical protein